jgi:hypothetical protein
VTLSTTLRAIAMAMALTGLVDPSWPLNRDMPVPVELRVSAEPGVAHAAEAVAQRLRLALDGRVAFNSDAAPAAVVLVGTTDLSVVPGQNPPAPGHPGTLAPAQGIPVSTVALTPPSRPNVRIVAVSRPPAVPPGWKTVVTAAVEARGLAGKTSAVVLEQEGAELARSELKWASDQERSEATLAYAPPVAGSWQLRVRVPTVEGEETSEDNVADVRLVAIARSLKVLTYEPRPSWGLTFVRRALEADATFRVSSLVRSSRGHTVRTGEPPNGLTGQTLEGFDAAVVGAPEELQAGETDALASFARRRGGTVVLLPDRRPAGRYLDLVPAKGFDELLVDANLPLQSGAGTVLRASEFAIPRQPPPGSLALASIEKPGPTRPVVLMWPHGAGHVVFSGALDSWRFRDTGNDAFGRFWRTRIAEAALLAPRRLELSLSPDAARPGDDITISARLRRTEWQEQPDGVRFPEMTARIVAKDGTQEIIRLWPTAEPGRFEGIVKPQAEGTYDVQVSSRDGVAVDSVLDVAAAVRHPAPSEDETAATLRVVAAATGGVAADATDLAPLERYLRALPSQQTRRPLHPSRSIWFLLTFVGLASAEWTLRRRVGKR